MQGKGPIGHAHLLGCLAAMATGRPDWANFSPVRIAYFGQLIENDRNSPNMKPKATFPRLGFCNTFGKKIGWEIFWSTFSQTHLVTLPGLAGRICEKTELQNWQVTATYKNSKYSTLNY
jgi:hypothetical protein